MRDWAIPAAPRSWQSAALQIWEERQRGVVSVVTGGGKTTFAEMCMIRFRARHPAGRVVILVPTTALLDQWFVSLTEELGLPPDQIACFSGEDRPVSPASVNVLVINTARTLAPSLADGVPAFLIVDECHRLGSPVNALALQGDYVATLGLSATPERDYDEGFEKYIKPRLGDIIFRYSYAEASRDGVITPFEVVNVRINLLPTEQKRFDQLSQRAAREMRAYEKGTGSELRLRRILQLRAAVSAASAMRVPVAAKLAEEHRGQRTVIFHERVDAANALLQILTSRKHNATVYHSSVSANVRRDNLRLYRRGVFDVLVSCRALDEGMNVPETAVAIIASGTASKRQRIQRLGRVLRPAAGKKHALIYTIYATPHEEVRLREEEESLEGVAQVTWLQGGLVHG